MKLVSGWAYPDADDFMWREMKPDGTYQASHIDLAMLHVTDRTIAIDGGAHVGTWSRLLSKLFDRVIAVEPSADTFEALTVNMATFGCANVEPHLAALGAEPGFVSIAPLDPRAEALKNTGARFVQDGGEIPRLRIDDWRLPSLGFLKLDVEGSEPLALRGAAETIVRCKPIVLYENKGLWRRFGEAKNAPNQVLQDLDYKLLQLAGRDAIWGPR